MSRPRIQFTTRRLLTLVAASALLSSCYRAWPSVRDFFQEDPWHAHSRMVKTWDLGPSPRVVVDLFEGGITVLRAADGKVTAEIDSHATTKINQQAADDALAAIVMSQDQFGDTLRITARGISKPVRKETNVILHVPDGGDLDLRTGRGSVYIGTVYKVGGAWSPAPIAARSIRVRNDSKYHFAYPEGNITVQCSSPRAPDGSPIPTRLQLDAPGRIEVVAELASIESYAWHGTHPPGWPPISHPVDGLADWHPAEAEGVITFEGMLAGGDHRLRAAHHVSVKLSGTTSVRVDATARDGPAMQGFITGNLPGSTIGPAGDQARWVGALGDGSGGALTVQVDDGSIVLDRKP